MLVCDVSYMITRVFKLNEWRNIIYHDFLCVGTGGVHSEDVLKCKFIRDRRGSLIKCMMQLIYVILKYETGCVSYE